MKVETFDLIVCGRKARVTVHETDDGGSFSYRVDGQPRDGVYRTAAKALGMGVLVARDELEEQHRKQGAANPHYAVERMPFQYGTSYTREWTYTGTSANTTSMNVTYYLSSNTAATTTGTGW